jgi:hypothetical protein
MQRWMYLLISFICGYAMALIIHQSPLGEKVSSAMSSFLPEKKWNWCPMDVTKLMNSKTSEEISDATLMADLCHASMAKVLPASTPGRFSAILRAQNKQGQVTFLEYDPSQKLFRIESKVFSSAKFEKSVGKVLELPK